jgi:hypothetical protein
VAPVQLLVRLWTQVGMEGAERETTERWMLAPALEDHEADD